MCGESSSTTTRSSSDSRSYLWDIEISLHDNRAAFNKIITAAPNATAVSNNVQTELTKSFSSAAATAQQYPQYSNQIIAAAQQSFLDGADWAYLAGIIAVLGGAALIYLRFPKHEEEERLLASYSAEDTASG